MSIADQIQKRIDDLLENRKNLSSEEQEIASSLNALPIYPDWSGFIAIRPDQSFLFCTEEGGVENNVEPEWQLNSTCSRKHAIPRTQITISQTINRRERVH